MKTRHNCQLVQEKLGRFVDGELLPAETAQVRLELESCDICRAEFEGVSRIRSVVREVYLEPIRTADLDDVLPSVLSRIDAEPVALTLRQRWTNWWEAVQLGIRSPARVFGGAAAVVVMLLVGTFVYYATSTPDRVDLPSPEVAATEPSADVEDTQQLPAEVGDELLRPIRTMPPVVVEKTVSPLLPPTERENAIVVTFYAAESGTVVIDADPDGDAPAVLWHFEDEEGLQEGGQI